jgi:hypothetical protein
MNFFLMRLKLLDFHGSEHRPYNTVRGLTYQVCPGTMSFWGHAHPCRPLPFLPTAISLHLA